MNSSTLNRMSKITAAVIAAMTMTIGSVSQVHAAPPTAQGSSASAAVITNVEPDLEAKTLRITGKKFSKDAEFVGQVEIYLAETGITILEVDSYVRDQTSDGVSYDQLVVSGLPANIAEFAGTHLVVLRKGTPTFGRWLTKSATFAVTIGGSGGVAGPEGPQGPAGPIGLQGEQGVAGPQGEQGAKGDTGTAGQDGQMAHKDQLVLRERKAQQENHCCQVQGLQMTASATMAIHTSINQQEIFMRRSQISGFLQGVSGVHGAVAGHKVSKVLLGLQVKTDQMELPLCYSAQLLILLVFLLELHREIFGSLWTQVMVGLATAQEIGQTSGKFKGPRVHRVNKV